MTIDNKIRDEKLHYNINREAAKISASLSGKIDSKTLKFFKGQEAKGLSSNLTGIKIPILRDLPMLNTIL